MSNYYFNVWFFYQLLAYMNKITSLQSSNDWWLWSPCQHHQHTFPSTLEHGFSTSNPNLTVTYLSSSPLLAAILDDQSVCGRGERLALSLARENINSVMEGPARARVEVDIYELQKDSQYDTTDTSEWSRCTPKKTSRADSLNPSEW